jgi:hypothetical protein
MSDRTNNEEKIFFPINSIFDGFYNIYPKHVKIRFFFYNGQIWGKNVTLRPFFDFFSFLIYI